MNLLAFDTSTETLSVAVATGAVVRQHTAAGGALASAGLIPVIEDLLARSGLTLAALDAIAFGRGPGSFTGLRTAAAVAQGLGFGTGVPLLPIDTLLAVAEDAHAACGATQVVAMLDARMGEVYFAAYERIDGAWITRTPPALGRAQEVPVPAGWTVAGNLPDGLAAGMPAGARRVAALPTAAALLRLAPAGLGAQPVQPASAALPLYIRDKVAQTTEERAADRARKESLRASGATEPT